MRLIPLLAVLFVAQAASAMPYQAVTAEDMPKFKLNHYFNKENKSTLLDFDWTFDKDGTFKMEAKEALPVHLRELLLSKDSKAKALTGKWAIANGEITFTEIKAGDEKGVEKAKMHVYRTAPTVIRIGEPQYVFGAK